MSEINNDYTTGALEFNYLNLRKYLYKMYEQGITDINLFLLISLEKEYYEGENLKRIIVDLVKLSQNLTINIDGKDIKFKVNKISLDVGDVLNRHRWIYRYNEKYMLEHNLKDGEEDKIPQDIQEEIQEKAYKTGKQQGFDWFKNHAVDAINEAIISITNSNNKDSINKSDNNITLNTLDSRGVYPHKDGDGNDSLSQSSYCHSREGGNPVNSSQQNTIKPINKDFKLTNGITSIFEGNEILPPIEYICYEYWLKHQNYEKVAKALNEVRDLPDSVIERTYDYEANYYLKRLETRNETQNFTNSFIKYSIDYLVDETVKHILIQQKTTNNLELYYYGFEPRHNIVFQGKKAQSNKIIKNYSNNELYGIIKGNWITIRKNNDN